MEKSSLPALEAVAKGRDHLSTTEFATATNSQPQTVRKNYSRTGECYGIRPTKVGCKLLWPVNATAELLTRGAK